VINSGICDPGYVENWGRGMKAVATPSELRSTFRMIG